MAKNKGKPHGMNYAKALTRRVALHQAAAVQIEADTRTQRAMWLMVCSIADAFGIGPERMVRDFFPAMQANAEELERMSAEVGQDFAFEKLRQRAEQVTGTKIEYLFEHEVGRMTHELQRAD